MSRLTPLLRAGLLSAVVGWMVTLALGVPAAPSGGLPAELKQWEQARRSRQAEASVQREIAQTNPTSAEVISAWARRYEPQYAVQAEREKAFLSGWKQAEPALEDRLREVRDKALAEGAPDAKLRTLATDQAAQVRAAWVPARIVRGMHLTLRNLRTRQATPAELAELWYFSQWFPAAAKEAGVDAFFSGGWPATKAEQAREVLFAAFATGDWAKAFDLALLEADPEGAAEWLGRWAQAAVPPAIDPAYWQNRFEGELGLRSQVEWDAVSPEERFEKPLSSADLGGVQTQHGLAWGASGEARGITSRESARKPATNPGEAVMAAYVLSGLLDGGPVDPAFPAALAQVRQWNPGYAEWLGLVARWAKEVESNPLALEVALQALLFREDLPARLPARLWRDLQARGKTYAQRLQAAGNDEAKRVALAAERAAFTPEVWAGFERNLAQARAGKQADELRAAAVALCEKELPEGFDEATNYEKPLPQGDVFRVIEALDRCTDAGVECAPVVNRLMKPFDFYLGRFTPDWDSHDYKWVADRTLRKAMLESVQRHLIEIYLARIETVPTEVAWVVSHLRILSTLLAPGRVELGAELYARALPQAKTPQPEPFANGWYYFSKAAEQLGQPALALTYFDRGREWVPTLADDPPEYILDLALRSQNRERAAKVAAELAAKTNDELETTEPMLLVLLGRVWGGEFGVKVDFARLEDLAVRLEKKTGALPPELQRFAPNRTPPKPGSADWEHRLVQLSFFLRNDRVPDYAIEAAWKLVEKSFDKPVGETAQAMVIPYCVLDLLAGNHGHEAAKKKLAALQASRDVETGARLINGIWFAVEPFTGADQLMEAQKKGEPWAVRAFELWVLQDKLPAYSIRDEYVAKTPEFNTPAVQAWLKEH